MRVLLASVMLAVFVPVAQARPVSARHSRQYTVAYRQVVRKLGARAPGRNILRDGVRSGRAATDGEITRSLGVLERMLNPPRVSSAGSAIGHAGVLSSGGGGLADVPGVPAGFAACVAFKESTDGKLSPNIYGLESYFAGESLAEQKQVFSRMYAASGDNPWRPYDHCVG